MGIGGQYLFSKSDIHHEHLMCHLKDSCVPLYNILLALLYIKEARKKIPPQTLELANGCFPVVLVCVTSQGKSQRRTPQENSAIFFHLLR